MDLYPGAPLETVASSCSGEMSLAVKWSLWARHCFRMMHRRTLQVTETVIAVIKLHRPISPPVKPGLAADFSRSRIDVPTRGEVGSAMGQSPAA